MDNIIAQQINELVAALRDTEQTMTDSVSKLMATALIYQTQKIKDDIADLPEKIIERLCSVYVPRNKVDATPAICLIKPSVKIRRDVVPYQLNDGISFQYKIKSKQSLSYYPLFRNLLLPYTKTYRVTPSGLHSDTGFTEIRFGKKGQVWLGLDMGTAIETMQYVSFLIKNSGGVAPERIAVCDGSIDLNFTDANKFDELPLAEPFDSQQMAPGMIDTIALWRRNINGGDSNRLVYITDPLSDRDAFKCRPYPKVFQQFLESNDLDNFDNNDILWILFDFGPDYEVPADMEIIPNVIPAVNVTLNNVTLTQSSPVAKLTKNDGSFFLSVVETPLSSQRQGFSVGKEEFIIRDFDASCYNPSLLYKDVRKLYNHFVDDYHAFIDYHRLKDGETIRSLRELINRIGKSVMTNPEITNRYDEGTYAMRNINLSAQNSPVKIIYLTTFGRIGNNPQQGDQMENKKDPTLAKEVDVITKATCGEDKADADRKYELLRYYTMTADRLYTKMDIDAFLRFQLHKEFGKEETKRISYDISIHGAGDDSRLVRGLYIDIKFKDEKNYQKARQIALDRKLHDLILDKSCISMPVLINLISLE